MILKNLSDYSYIFAQIKESQDAENEPYLQRAEAFPHFETVLLWQFCPPFWVVGGHHSTRCTI